MKLLLPMALVLGLVSASNNATAASITFNTSDSQFDAGVDNQGWWSPTFSNTDSNDNYIVGQFNGALYRNFFTFDLSTLSLLGQTITSATLEVARYDYAGSSTETVEFFDVSTAANVLNNNNGTNAAIYNDLGTGTSYGSFIVPRYDSSSTLLLPFALNAGARTNIAAAAGGYFSIGGVLQSITGGSDQHLFGFSDGPGIQRLVIETAPTTAAPVPEPASLLLLGSGLIGATVRRYRRRIRS